MFARGGPGGVTEKHWSWCCTAVMHRRGGGHTLIQEGRMCGVGGKSKGGAYGPEKGGKGCVLGVEAGGGVGRGRYKGVGGSGRY